jgi:hypothetical protein
MNRVANYLVAMTVVATLCLSAQAGKGERDGKYAGEVTAIDSASITIRASENDSHPFTVDDKTAVLLPKERLPAEKAESIKGRFAPGTIGDVKVGDRVKIVIHGQGLVKELTVEPAKRESGTPDSGRKKEAAKTDEAKAKGTKPLVLRGELTSISGRSLVMSAKVDGEDKVFTFTLDPAAKITLPAEAPDANGKRTMIDGKAEDLRPGHVATVKYREENGDRVVTVFAVEPGKKKKG